MSDRALGLSGREFEERRPALRSDTQSRLYGNEAVAWSAVSPDPVGLDAVSTVLFQLFDGSASTAELIADVHEALGVPASIAASQIRRVVTAFDAAGLLVDSPLPPAGEQVSVFPAPPNP